MQVLRFNKKAIYINTTENILVYKETTKDNQLNEKHTLKPNRIFEAVVCSESSMPLDARTLPSPLTPLTCYNEYAVSIQTQ